MSYDATKQRKIIMPKRKVRIVQKQTEIGDLIALKEHWGAELRKAPDGRFYCRCNEVCFTEETVVTGILLNVIERHDNGTYYLVNNDSQSTSTTISYIWVEDGSYNYKAWDNLNGRSVKSLFIY